MKHRLGITPGDLLNFLYLGEFEDKWNNLYPGDQDELALSALEIAITMNPKAGNVIKGTGGLRKVRFAAISDQTGKRSGCRVCYVYLEDYHLVLMVTVYAKNQKSDLSPAERAGIKAYIELVERWFEKQSREGRT